MCHILNCINACRHYHLLNYNECDVFCSMRTHFAIYAVQICIRYGFNQIYKMGSSVSTLRCGISKDMYVTYCIYMLHMIIMCEFVRCLCAHTSRPRITDTTQHRHEHKFQLKNRTRVERARSKQQRFRWLPIEPICPDQMGHTANSQPDANTHHTTLHSPLDIEHMKKRTEHTNTRARTNTHTALQADIACIIRVLRRPRRC